MKSKTCKGAEPGPHACVSSKAADAWPGEMVQRLLIMVGQSCQGLGLVFFLFLGIILHLTGNMTKTTRTCNISGGLGILITRWACLLHLQEETAQGLQMQTNWPAFPTAFAAANATALLCNRWVRMCAKTFMGSTCSFSRAAFAKAAATSKSCGSILSTHACSFSFSNCAFKASACHHMLAKQALKRQLQKPCLSLSRICQLSSGLQELRSSLKAAMLAVAFSTAS